MYFASFKQCSICNNLQHILWIFYRYLTGVDPPLGRNWGQVTPDSQFPLSSMERWPDSSPLKLLTEVSKMLVRKWKTNSDCWLLQLHFLIYNKNLPQGH